MSKDELKAWLLLAGFKQHRYSNKYVQINRYADYIAVEFMAAGRIEVGLLTGRHRFLFPERAQRFIQEVLKNQS